MALCLALAAACSGCGKVDSPWFWLERPSDSLPIWKEYIAPGGKGSLVLFSDDAYLGGARPEWSWNAEEESAAVKHASDAGFFEYIVWVLPYSVSDWNSEDALSYLKSRGVPVGHVEVAERGFRFQSGKAEVLLTGFDNRGHTVSGGGSTAAWIDASFFSRAYLGLGLGNLSGNETPSPSALLKWLRRRGPAVIVLQSRLSAHEHAMMLAGEAALLSIRNELDAGLQTVQSSQNAAHEVLLKTFVAVSGAAPEKNRYSQRQDVCLAEAVAALKLKDAVLAAKEARRLESMDGKYALLRDRFGEFFFHYATPEDARVFYEVFDGAAAKNPLAAAGDSPAPGTGRPPIILVTVDTLRADGLNIYNPAAHSPQLASLADGAAVMENAYAAIPQTVPSHAAMLTGRHPASMGLHDNGLTLPAGQPTLAQLLKRHGYTTAAFVSGFPLAAGVSALHRGFDVYDDEMTTALSPASPEMVERKARDTTAKALDWLESAKNEKPLFLWVHYYDPHYPYWPPVAFEPLGDWPMPLSIRQYFAAAGGKALSPEARRQRGRYYGEVAYADSESGKLWEALRKKGILNQALVIVAADHGESLGEHEYFFDHGDNALPPNARVPFFIRLPGERRAVARIAAPVCVGSITPTVAEILGIKIPWETDYLSLLPLIQGKSRTSPPIFIYTGDVFQRKPGALSQVAVVSGDWFYAENAAGDNGLLARLDLDPMALAPVFDSAKEAELRRVLQTWKASLAGRTHGQRAVPLTEEQRNKLKSLGYLQ